MKNIAKSILLVSGIVVTLLFTGTVLGYASNNEDGMVLMKSDCRSFTATGFLFHISFMGIYWRFSM